MPKNPIAEIEIRFTDRDGNWMPYKVPADEAIKARLLLGARRIGRYAQARYTIEAPGTDGKRYDVDLFELLCSCPQVAMHRVRVCKHLICAQWLENIFNGVV